MLFISFFASALSLKPIYLIAGFGQSPIYSTITQPDLYPECPEVNRLFIRSATSSNTNWLNSNPKCAAKLLRVHLNESTGKVEQLPGIVTDSSPIGDAAELSATFESIISKAKAKGYTSNQNLFSVGYNYYLHPVTSFDVYDKLKAKIEEVYANTKEKAVIVSFSQGTSFASIFLSNYSTSEWVKQYIDSVVFIAPAFAGWPLFSQLMSQTLSPLPNSDEMKKTIMKMPGLHIMMPNYEVFKHRTVIYNLYKDFDQHNASYAFEFLKSQNKADDESEQIFKAYVEKFLQAPIPEPPVPSLIVYNDAITQTVTYSVYQHQNKKVVSLYGAPGDNTVTSDGAEYACGHWKSVKCKNLHEGGVNHNTILGNSRTISEVFSFIETEKPIREDPKVGLFLCSGFQGSPLYATVTDPEKAPMCPSNMKNFLFYTTFVNNLYRFVDDKDSSLWLSDECLAMLTRVELDETEKSVTYAPGIHLKSSLFGDYNHLLSYTGIITRAYEEGYTHRKDLFGVGYNYMLHPLMSNEIYEELKTNIEKYYDETGKKSVITGHSQGTSFVEIFITDYVSKEWAQKYVAGVIFYAPAFAGWGTYGRLVSSNYGGIFPDSTQEMKKSTSRMPGLHIMMPNEGVYGSKTVIKNFPNDGDNSNASFAAPLLKQLGRMDETAEKIFHLTDKYRKPPLPEPPVPSLVIFNNFTNTGNGYTYNKNTNSVSGFNGKGDGTVSDDGPIYACSHWSDVICYNYQQSGIGHSNIQTTQKTLDLTFEFIERVKHSKPVPKDKTYFLKGVEGNYDNEVYVNSHAVSNEKFTATSDGDKSSYPLSNAFDNKENTYWIASKSNSDSFMNTITVNFKSTTKLEAILYDTAYITRGESRRFDGFPTRVNVYTATGKDDFQLNSVFIGTPVYPWKRVQFVFPTAVTCDKIKLEFDDVTEQTLADSGQNPISGGIYFMEKFDYDTIPLSPVKGHYANEEYVDSQMIKNDKFTATSDGDKASYPLSNAFDYNNKTYWIADKANDDTFTNSIIVEFKSRTKLEAILYDTAYFTRDEVRTFNGFPTTFTIHTAKDGEEFKTSAVFIGNPVYPWSRIQFVFDEIIECDRIKLEFTKVTVQTMVGSSENPVTGNIIFIQPKESIALNKVEGNYANAEYVNSHKISTDSFTYTNNGGSKNNYPITNLFDANEKSFWVSDTENTKEFLNTITVSFNSQTTLEAFLYDTAYSTSGQTRAFQGFPTKLYVYASTGNEGFKLIELFEGNPIYPWTRIQFVFKSPVTCDKIKLEFDGVTTQNLVSPFESYPVSGGLLFIKGVAVTSQPTIPVIVPTDPPTKEPTQVPTEPPTKEPTEPPTKEPTEPPTKEPTEPPTEPPTQPPTQPPTEPPTEAPTQVPPTEAPTQAPSDEPVGPVVDSDTCKQGEKHCELEGSQEKQIIVSISHATFTRIVWHKNGGAIHLINAGIRCETVQFSECSTSTGGGGGIFINNDADLQIEITLEDVKFSACQAQYGGALYIFSMSDLVPVMIRHTTFSDNSVTGGPFNGDHFSSGGSAAFIAVKNGIMSDATFSHNRGEGGQLKVCNHFTQRPNDRKNGRLSVRLDNSFLISDCSFETDEESKSALFFVLGEKGSSVEVRKCTFSGTLADDSYYIDGQKISEESPKLFVNSCKFDKTAEKSLNQNEDFMSIDIDHQDFNTEEASSENGGNEQTKKDKGYDKTTLFLLIGGAVGVVLIVVLIVVIVTLAKKRSNPNQAPDEIEMSSRTNDFLLNQSLV